MTITSFIFVLFTALALGVYYNLPLRKQNVWLLFISYGFIDTWDWKFAFTLGILTTANFVIALRLRANDQGQRNLLWAGIGLNVLFLIFFRAANFFLLGLESLLERMGIPTEAGGLHILIPLGLSFYILQAISYLVDVYRGQVRAEKNWIEFTLYLA